MNRLALSLLVLITAVLLCSQLAYGQQNSSTTGDRSAETALREKAYELLESLADQLGTLQSAENRARIGSNIASSLWKNDEKRARALFKLVEDDIKLGLQRRENDPYYEHTLNVFLRLREDNAERIAQHDPELALAFLADTFPAVKEGAQRPDGQLPLSISEKEREFEMRLAKRISAVNPEFTVKLARQALARGFSNDLPSLLRKINAKDKDQAQVLYKEIVNKLRDANLSQDWRAREFVQNLVRLFTPPEADEPTYKELLQILLTQAFANGCDKQISNDDERSAFCEQIGELGPLFEKFYPAQARRLNQWAADWDVRNLGVSQFYTEINEVAENGKVEEVLALTSKYPELEAQILLRAMWVAESAGEVERAKKIASSYNGDPQIRQVMEQRLKAYEMESKRAAERLAQIQNNISTLPLPQQIHILLDLAYNLAPRNKEASLKVLTQVNGMVDTLKPGGQQTEFQIAMALIYSLAKSDRGFAIVESLIPKLNELVAAAAKLDGFDTRYLRDGEWNMTGEGVVGNILTVLANNAGFFAWCDFDRAVTLAGQFERSEIRMMAQLKLAQGILSGPPKRPRPFRVIE